MFTFPFWLRVLLALSTSFAVSGSYAQKTTTQSPSPSVTFSQVGLSQFNTSTADSTAEAVVLYDLGDVQFEVAGTDIWMVFTHHVRTLIRKKSGYDRATLSIPTRRSKSGRSEFVSDIDGYSYNSINGVIKAERLAKTGHFTERVSDTYQLEKYTLPSVREGSIIEYKYTVRTPFSVAYSPRTWRFQQEIPVNWSEYRIEIPDYFYYKIMLGGYLPPALNEKKTKTSRLLPGYETSSTAYRLAISNAPAFKDEAYITTDEDYLSKIDFELASYTFPNETTKNFSVTWESLDKTLLDDSQFGRQYKRVPFLRETARSILDQHKDSLSRVTAAYNVVRQSFKWNGEVSFLTNNLKKVFDDKKGDAADINLLLIALLREMNLDANPVILSTRTNGRIDENYALINRFNYVVAHVLVGGKDLLLDATDPYLKPGSLPTRCLNGQGRLVTTTGSRFLSLASTERESKIFSGRFRIDQEGDIAGTLEHVQTGHNAWNAHKEFATQGHTKYLDGIRKSKVSWQIDKATFTVPDATDDKFKGIYTMSIPEACSRAGDRLYLRPMLTEAHGVNVFKEPERIYPVDFGVPVEESFSAIYDLPDGFQVEEMPKAANLALPENGGRFLYQVSLTGDNKLQIVSRLTLRNAVYSAEAYPALRELFTLIVAKHAEQVVLKRTTLAEKRKD